MESVPEPSSPSPSRILFLGDIVGEPGRKAVCQLLPKLKEELALDFIIVNGENSAGGTRHHPQASDQSDASWGCSR